MNKILIGNKCDWSDKRAVTEEQGRALADELGIKFMETSAKINEGVEEAFFTLARCVLSIYGAFTLFNEALWGTGISRRGLLTHKQTRPQVVPQAVRPAVPRCRSTSP